MQSSLDVLGRYRVFVTLLLVTQFLATAVVAEDRSSLDIVTESGTHRYYVELATTPQQRSVGLMHRESMDQDAGMLFRFDWPQQASMWMRNTLIPLDMVFIRADGIVADLHRNAVPHSEEIIQSSEPVLYVLELNAGVADKIALKPGSRILHPIIQGE